MYCYYMTGKDHIGDLRVDGRVLKLVMKKQDMRTVRFSEHSRKPSNSAKGWASLDKLSGNELLKMAAVSGVG
jgi:hypothetical protein